MTNRDAVMLLDLPDHLLRQCIPAWHKPVLRVCWRLQTLLLQGTSSSSDKGKSVKLLVHLGQVSLEGPNLAQTLAKTPALSRIQILGRPGMHLEQHLEGLLRPDLHPAAGALHEERLAHITHVQLTNYTGPAMRMQQLLPDILTQLCPNLQHLELSGISLTAPQQQTQEKQQQQQQQKQQQQVPAPCSQQIVQQQQENAAASSTTTACTSLHTLQLHYTFISSSLPQLQQQLQQLPNLQTLHWHVWCDLDQTPYYAAFPAGLCASLTELHVCISNLTQAQLLYTHTYPNLRTLELCYPTIDDALLARMLQQLPQLRQLTVKDFALQQDHSNAACSWQVLGVCTVDVASCARLPLHHCQQLHCTSLNTCSITLAHAGQGMEEDMRLTQRAVAVVAGCGGLRQPASNPCMHVHVGAAAPQYMHDVQLTATLPLLADVCRLTLGEVHNISSNLLAGLGQLHKCTELCFVDCTFDSLAWRMMLGCLPHVQQLGLYLPHVTVEQLVQLCTSAAHAVTVRVSRPPGATDVQEVQATGQDILSSTAALASHGLVRLLWT